MLQLNRIGSTHWPAKHNKRDAQCNTSNLCHKQRHQPGAKHNERGTDVGSGGGGRGGGEVPPPPRHTFIYQSRWLTNDVRGLSLTNRILTHDEEYIFSAPHMCARQMHRPWVMGQSNPFEYICLATARWHTKLHNRALCFWGRWWRVCYCIHKKKHTLGRWRWFTFV